MYLNNFSTKRIQINKFPFDTLWENVSNRGSKQPREIVQDFAQEYSKTLKHSGLIDEFLPLLGNKQVISGTSGLDCKTTLDAALGSEDDAFKGAFCLLKFASRGYLVDKQISDNGIRHCALVPLMLYAFKLYQDIDYDRWDRSTLGSMLEPDLYDAVTSDYPEVVDEEAALASRAKGLEIKSGDKAGTSRISTSTYKLYGLGKGDYGFELPWLAQVMLTQIWVAHPTLRHKNMILDPRNLAATPPALPGISGELNLKASREVQKAYKTKPTQDLW